MSKNNQKAQYVYIGALVIYYGLLMLSLITVPVISDFRNMMTLVLSILLPIAVYFVLFRTQSSRAIMLIKIICIIVIAIQLQQIFVNFNSFSDSNRDIFTIVNFFDQLFWIFTSLIIFFKDKCSEETIRRYIILFGIYWCISLVLNSIYFFQIFAANSKYIDIALLMGVPINEKKYVVSTLINTLLIVSNIQISITYALIFLNKKIGSKVYITIVFLYSVMLLMHIFFIGTFSYIVLSDILRIVKNALFGIAFIMYLYYENSSNTSDTAINIESYKSYM